MINEALLFVHSTGTTQAMWNGAQLDLPRIAPSNLGYPPNPLVSRGARVTAKDDADNLVAAVLRENVARVHVIAHSYGALVALLARTRLPVASAFLYEPVMFGALAHETDPDLEAGIAEAKGFLAEPFLLDDNEKSGTDPWLEAFIDYWNRPGSWQRLPEGAKDAMRMVGWKMFQEVRACFFEVDSFDPFAVDFPVTYARGDRSPPASRAMAQALAKRSPGSAKLVDLKGTGHMAPITHPQLVLPAIAAHLEWVSTNTFEKAR